MIIQLLILHFIADFLLQSREMGKNKSIYFSFLLEHVVIICGVFFVALVMHRDLIFGNILLFVALNGLIHGLIDWNIWRLYKASIPRRFPTLEKLNKFQYYEDSWFYHTIGLDQMLHVSTLVLLAGWLL